MPKQIIIKVGKWQGRLTAAQLREVLLVAGNGLADFYVNENGEDTGCGGKRQLRVYTAGEKTLVQAFRQATDNPDAFNDTDA